MSIPEQTASAAASKSDASPDASQGRYALVAVLLGVALAMIDTAIANTALPTIASDLHIRPASSVWIVNAYQLAVIATLLPLGALGDKIGQRRVFIGGLIVFVVASLGCAAAPSLLALSLARVVQGIGGSAIMSTNTALIRFIYPPHRLGRGLATNALVVGVSFAVGPTIASLVLSVGPWPWLFAINIPLGLLALVFSVRGLPRAVPGGQRLDPLAAFLNIVTFAALAGTLIAVAQRAGAPLVFGAMATTLIFGALLLRRESGRSAPMLPIDLFGQPVFTLSTITAIAAFATQGLAFVSLPFYFEGALHRSQIETGFLLTPWSAVVAVISPLGGRLADRYAPAIPCAIGLAILSIGMISLAMLPAQPLAVDIGVRMAICGAGFSLFQSPNLKALMGSVPAARSGGANGVISSARLLGQASGAALVALSLRLAGAHGPTLALFAGASFAALAAVTSALRLLANRPTPGV